ncbi:MAG: ribose 5-phosphate isomerase B [Dysgonamonadaceae bacterium]|jgi:ribose 5-phosphate isomerase B|nr:ribose 5-phosphate isomerase B [Dysgonamonadaceae bacterium]
MENTNRGIVGLASDHAGYELKEFIRVLLDKKDIPYIDYGTYSAESVDYAVFGHKLAEAVEKSEIQRGIGVCGSGNGINITLNKHAAIRSALCWNEEITRLARAHNDANILALPGRFLSMDLAEKIVTVFLSTPFDGGRHQARIDAIPIIRDIPL